MLRFETKIVGIDKVRNKLGMRAAENLSDALDLDIAQETRKMAIQAAKNAPVETGALRSSILSSVRRDGTMTYYFGSYLPYALRQEYEHKSRSPFFRQAYWDGFRPTYVTIGKTIKKRLG